MASCRVAISRPARHVLATLLAIPAAVAAADPNRPGRQPLLPVEDLLAPSTADRLGTIELPPTEAVAVNELAVPAEPDCQPAAQVSLPELEPAPPLDGPATGEPDEPQPGFGWPLHGRLTSRYGWRRRQPHSGIDIAASRGTIIVAAAAGTVSKAGKRWGRYGKVVLIDHADGYRTLYAHTSRSLVREGQAVLAGQPVAAVGTTGNATGPHLHFEVWQGDRTLDPLAVLRPAENRAATLLSSDTLVAAPVQAR